jgi:hypothetical protein
MNKQLFLRIAAVIGIFGFVVVFMGNGCAKEFVTWNGNSPIDLSSTGLVGSGVSSTTDITVIPDTKSVSMVYSNEVLSHLTACAGVASPSDATLAMYDAKKGAISVYGQANTITSPMMMAVTSIAAEVCNDLINQEIATGPRIFQNIDFNANAMPADTDLGNAITRLALSCWSRPEDSSEHQRIINMVTSTVGSSETQAARKSSLMICTSMLSSLDALMN